jgi:hypothetical protein
MPEVKVNVCFTPTDIIIIKDGWSHTDTSWDPNQGPFDPLPYALNSLLCNQARILQMLMVEETAVPGGNHL